MVGEPGEQGVGIETGVATIREVPVRAGVRIAPRTRAMQHQQQQTRNVRRLRAQKPLAWPTHGSERPEKASCVDERHCR